MNSRRTSLAHANDEGKATSRLIRGWHGREDSGDTVLNPGSALWELRVVCLESPEHHQMLLCADRRWESLPATVSWQSDVE
jgi:hypothetical protein